MLGYRKNLTIMNMLMSIITWQKALNIVQVEFTCNENVGMCIEVGSKNLNLNLFFPKINE